MANRIAEITARCEAATPGPWDIILNGHNIKVERTPANIDFIAHAREDVPYLLAQLAERDREIERLQAERDAAVEDLKIRDRREPYGGKFCKYKDECYEENRKIGGRFPECEGCDSWEWRGKGDAE